MKVTTKNEIKLWWHCFTRGHKSGEVFYNDHDVSTDALGKMEDAPEYIFCGGFTKEIECRDCKYGHRKEQ